MHQANGGVANQSVLNLCRHQYMTRFRNFRLSVRLYELSDLSNYNS